MTQRMHQQLKDCVHISVLRPPAEVGADCSAGKHLRAAVCQAVC